MQVGAPVPLTGRYAAQGAWMRAGLVAWARDSGARLELVDDGSSPDQAVRVAGELAERCPLVLGPYGSDCVRAVARAGAAPVVWNHGGAADDVQRLPGVVSLPSPASRYLVALGRAVALERPGARVHVAVAPGAFARLAREGLEREAGALGLSLVDEPDTADAVLLCGPIEWEAGELRRLRPSGQALIGAVSAGLVPGSDPDAWPGATLAPVQWHPDLPSAPELGPARPNVENYVAAQAYAAAVLATHCRTLDAARGLRTTTFFGGFALAPDGLQVGHRLAVVRRRGRRTEVVLAGAA